MTLCSQDGRGVGHLSPDELVDCLPHLGLDAVLDARGAPIDQQQCPRLVNLLAATGFSGALDLGEAQFGGVANFREARFTGAANFRRAQFSGGTYFTRVRFGGDAYFNKGRFDGTAFFAEAQFSRTDFGAVQRRRSFRRAQFGGAHFAEAQNPGDTRGRARPAARSRPVDPSTPG
jgi:uncharacterized protein YjbI with pentapeptide repeats